MAQTYYKVTIGGRSINNVFRNRYKRNQWTKAKKIWSQQTKLFIFKDFDDAAYFADQFWDICVIWKCHVKNPKKLNYREKISEKRCLYNFWEDYNNKKRISIYAKTPKGTYCCDSVKLIKKVANSD